MKDYLREVKETVSFLENHLPWPPDICVVLGTGLGGVADTLKIEFSMEYNDIPGFVTSTSPEHKGRLVAGLAGSTRVVICQGRFHYYEGYSTRQTAFPVRVMASMGTDILVTCSASGGLNKDFMSGDLMVVEDHINLIPENPLRGPNFDELGERFPDMSTAYTPFLRERFIDTANSLGIRPRTGVFVAVPGPSLETPAETRFLRNAGAEAVAMSMVPEVITAAHAGMDVLGIAVIANVNDPDNFEPILIEDVVRNAKRAEDDLSAILSRFFKEYPWKK